MPLKKKKFQSGEGARYVTRRAALNKLQLSLKDFRTLCIIKGIYPREPAHRRRAQKGKSGIQILYLKKDILFLMHEPMIWKLRELQVHLKRLKRAKGMHQKDLVKRYSSTIPRISIDHVVKERYPTFIDALRDMDDALTLCCLFATFPKMISIPPNLIALCRRLTIEFMHYCIAARALRKVFISIKGIYFQVEIKGQLITWIIPHNYPHEPQKKQEVDFYTMATFADFYSTAIGFVNYRLYHTINLYYPPRLGTYNAENLEEEILEENETSDRVAALNLALQKTAEDVEDPADEELDLDAFPLEGDEAKAEEARKEYEKVRKLKKLFEGLKVFLNREVPREPLVFALRCFGAKVSWDETTFPEGALFPETDETITHQIVDRPDIQKQYISRYYIQPQWVFDCVNARELLPVEKYFIGMVLPPHLSPFTVEYKTQRYIPPEEKALTDPTAMPNTDQELLDDISDNDIEDIDDEKNELDDDKKMDSDTSIEEDEFDGEITEEILANMKRKKMKVESGTPEFVNKGKLRQEMKQLQLLKEKMIQKKYKNLYKSMKSGRIKREKEIKLLKYKRRIHERSNLESRRAEIKARRAQAATLV
ncbi:pescadillo homolog [Daktulosphaira vitifoliae]|uniref:pescadillo homolog n=1 Tax=Daktulosphaira vitifoliae TaxID=58002 RepID=UPI0021AA7648|nr:pescadillo homolog [Daktulosphaira vitifoliae]